MPRKAPAAAVEDGALRVTGATWCTIKVLRPDADPTPLTFASLEEARAYAARDKRTRVVRVADDGTRELVQALFSKPVSGSFTASKEGSGDG